jgi:histone acetyltransferase (RNA polymerase elongator complex component)
VKTGSFDRENIQIVVRQFYASDGIEYFISHESMDNLTLYSLLRLRINSIHNECVFPELQECTMIREVHEYGKMVRHSEITLGQETQHRGLGTELVNKAIEISKDCGYHNIAVISGIGVNQYYIRKLGFNRGVYGYLTKSF